ncbi:hypothetical protein HPB49_011994 [Dermacentor silvarum]|uniref:Uncharacterized protein n=1 Tax=Dermacentor silvarum TaxID=543639 RepID=A0ACB8C971_DERSI|nr:hypothetical protein HPB49_011994 [Dermacentor silvarum]
MAGRLRRGGYLPVRPYWVPHQYRYRGPPRQPVAQRCTCYSPAGFRARPPPPPYFPPPTPSSGRALRTPTVQQATPCKACEAMRCRVLSQRRDRDLRERLRAEERIKHLEEEMAIHERSRQEEVVCQEETREAEETARLERELLMGELWRRSRAREDILEGDTAGKVQCRVMEETRLNDGGYDVSGTTASDRVIHVILEPSDTKSEALLIEYALERQQREERTAYDDTAAGNRPTWYRARCSAGEIQEFDKEISVDSSASVPTGKTRVKGGGIFSTTVQEKTTTHHSDLDISFAKEFVWESDFVLSPPKPIYSENVTRSADAIRKTSTPSLRHARKASTGASSVALKPRANQRKQDRIAHLDKHVPSQASKSAEDAKVRPEKSKKLEHRRMSSRTTSHGSSGSAKKLTDAKSTTSEEKKSVDTQCRTAGRKSTAFLASSIDDSKWVARETGEPIHHDAQTWIEEALIAKSASLARSSGALSSGLYATAAEEPAAQATKTEARVQTEMPKEDGNVVASSVPTIDAATTAAVNQLDDGHGGVSVFSDPAVISKMASQSPVAEIVKEDSRDAPAAGDSASRRRLVSPPPAFQARAVESPPVPETVFSGRGILLIAAALLILWLTIILIAVVTTRNGHTSEMSENTGSDVFTTGHSKPTSASRVYLCDTEPCLREGAYLNRLLSDDTHPCTNFYKYVCERWSPERAATNSSSRRFWSRDTIIEAEMEDKSVKFVTSNPENVRPLQALLQACNDHPLASSAMAELRKLFQQWNIDEWPLPPYSRRSREDVWTLAGDLLRDLGLAALVDIFPARDPNDDRRALIAIDLPELLHFPRGDAAETQLVRAAVKEALYLFDVIDVSDVDRFASDVVHVFEVLEVLYPSVTRDEAEVSNLSEVDAGFRKLINRAIRGNGTNAEHLEGEARVLLLNSRFAKALPGALGLLSTQAILNHLVVRALVRLAAFLPDNMSSLRRLSFLETAGRSEKPEALSLCLRTLERAAPSCFFRALAQPPSSTAALQRHWLSDLETVLVRALPRLPWLDALSSTIVAERLRLLRIDASFIGSAKSDVPCAASDVRVLRTPIAALVEVFRRRPLQSLASWWRRALPLGTWPTLDLPSGRVVRVPPGLINGSVPANGSLLFAFHLARVAVRLYAALMPVLHAKSLYDHSFPLTEQSERNSRSLLACMTLGEWRQWAAPEGSSRDNWLRGWLLEQTLALELGLHSFRELSATGRVWKLDPRFANLADVTSTQLFFVYYALDHCERRADQDAEHTRRELLLRRRLPSAALVNLPLRNMPAFTDAFGCTPGDYLTAQLPCRLFRH